MRRALLRLLLTGDERRLLEWALEMLEVDHLQALADERTRAWRLDRYGYAAVDPDAKRRKDWLELVSQRIDTSREGT